MSDPRPDDRPPNEFTFVGERKISHLLAAGLTAEPGSDECKHTTLGGLHVAAGTSGGKNKRRGCTQDPERDISRAHHGREWEAKKGGREERVIQGERVHEGGRGRKKREKKSEKEGGRKHRTRFLGKRVRSVGPVSRFVSDWCRVRGSRENTARVLCAAAARGPRDTVPCRR